MQSLWGTVWKAKHIFMITDNLLLCLQLPLGTKTVAMTALHSNSTLEYDAHNLYGLAETRVTAEIMARAHGSRPFILTRRAPWLWPLYCARSWSAALPSSMTVRFLAHM